MLTSHNSMVSCQNNPTRHAYAWQIGPFWQDTLELSPKVYFGTYKHYIYSPNEHYSLIGFLCLRENRIRTMTTFEILDQNITQVIVIVE